ncbi:MAG TPA: AI-2E family transporter, partial [Thermoanaerobaculia bacterium]|nr:AI-2E family transporter [Thermoanaerobaculia bacterium]
GRSPAGGIELRRFARRPADVRSAALTGLLILAVFYTLFFAQTFLLPVVLAVLLDLLLSPVVNGLKRLRVPEWLGAGIVVVALVGVLAGGVWLLLDPALAWLDRAPESLARVAQKLEALRGPVEQVSRATEEVERIAGGATGGGARTVQVEEQSLSAALLEQAQAMAAGAVVMLALLYFLLASGDLFLRKLIRVLPTFDDKKRAVDIARALQSDISVYLSTITLINVAEGLAVGCAMYLLGMPNPVLWGVLATVLNFIPYLGAAVGIAIVALVAALTFDNPLQMVLPPLVYLALTSAEGYLFTPTILGRRLTLNPVVILLGLIFWGWLWGIAGAVLAVPMLASFKIFCDHIEPLAPIGEFLGR